MIPEQPPLLPPAIETRTERDVARLIGILAGRGWMSAAEIRAAETGWTDRRIRVLAASSFGRVMSWPGSPGYILTHEASAVDRDRCAAVLRSTRPPRFRSRSCACATSSPTCPRTDRPSSSTTSAAMPGNGALNAHGFNGSSTLPITMPPLISVPPE